MRASVIVVGGGPVGLMLAGELRLGGADVLLLERRHTVTTESRASTLHARTMEILDSRGLLDPLGGPPNLLRGHFGGLPMDLTLPGSHPGQWKVPQARTEELLEKWAGSLGAGILRGYELVALTVTEEGVEAAVTGPDGVPRTVRGDYLVGCDGEESTVRRLTGAAFPGHDAVRELLRADVAGIDIPDRRFERLPAGLAIAARQPGGVTRVMVHEFGRTFVERSTPPEFGEIAEMWRRVTGEEIGAGTPLWVNSFGDASRQLTHYRHGRVLFAGDAAHRQLPVGGQALNLGLQDAVNLGWKLAAVVLGQAPQELLDTYHDERHPVGRRVLANIEAQARLLLGGAEVEPLRTVVGELLRYDDVRRHLAGTISGLDVRYDLGLASGAHELLGRRAADVPLTVAGVPTRPAELLRTGRGVLLLLADRALNGVLTVLAEAWADRVDLVTAETPADGPLAGVAALLIRPDGHVAWCATGPDDPRAALRRWFGPAGTRPSPSSER
ncbi:FAD-dependent monooxygenase [Micromonospora chokoriensis]